MYIYACILVCVYVFTLVCVYMHIHTPVYLDTMLYIMYILLVCVCVKAYVYILWFSLLFRRFVQQITLIVGMSVTAS